MASSNVAAVVLPRSAAHAAGPVVAGSAAVGALPTAGYVPIAAAAALGPGSSIAVVALPVPLCTGPVAVCSMLLLSSPLMLPRHPTGAAAPAAAARPLLRVLWLLLLRPLQRLLQLLRPQLLLLLLLLLLHLSVPLLSLAVAATAAAAAAAAAVWRCSPASLLS